MSDKKKPTIRLEPQCCSELGNFSETVIVLEVKFKCDCKHPQDTLLHQSLGLILGDQVFQDIQEEWLCISDSFDHLSNTHHMKVKWKVKACTHTCTFHYPLKVLTLLSSWLWGTGGDRSCVQEELVMLLVVFVRHCDPAVCVHVLLTNVNLHQVKTFFFQLLWAVFWQKKVHKLGVLLCLNYYFCFLSFPFYSSKLFFLPTDVRFNSQKLFKMTFRLLLLFAIT